MLYFIMDDFFKNVFPKLGTPEVWDIYNKFYYKPNQKILQRHFSRWNEFQIKKLKNKVNKWGESDFINVIEAVEAFDGSIVKDIVEKSENWLGEINNLEIYFIIGDFRSGIYIDRYENKNIIVIAFEFVGQYGKTEEVLLPALSHELFHLYHYSRLDNKEINRKDSFTKLLVDDGLASYFAHMINPKYDMEKILFYSKEQLDIIKSNEQMYWQEIFQAMQSKSLNECILLFNAPKKMWQEKLSDIPNWPPRISYYYGYKIIEYYIRENGEKYIKDLMFIRPEYIISESKYLEELKKQ